MILAGSHVAFFHPSFDTPRDRVGDHAHAIEQHVAVAQQDAVVMLAGVAHFPEHLAVPVCLEGDTAQEKAVKLAQRLREAKLI